MAALNDAPLPEWVRPDLWLDENNAIQFFTMPSQGTDPCGATWWHRRPETTDDPLSATPGWCVGTFQWRNLSGPLWTLEAWEPLTISPSLLCSCGAHGFIKSGKWIPA